MLDTKDHILVIITLIVVFNLTNSRSGRAIKAIRDNRIAAEAMGLKITKYKLMAFVTGSALAGLAGALYAHMNAFIGMDSIQQSQSVVFITMLLFGGSGNLVGPILGALVITLVQEGFQSLQDYRMLIYGIFLLIVILFQPKGVVGLGQTFSGLLSKKGGAANGNS